MDNPDGTISLEDWLEFGDSHFLFVITKNDDGSYSTNVNQARVITEDDIAGALRSFMQACVEELPDINPFVLQSALMRAVGPSEGDN